MNEQPLRLLNRGPDYYRDRILMRERPGLDIRRNANRKSAVELLEESKSLYVKSERVLDSRQLPKNAEVLHIPLQPRRKTSTTSLGESSCTGVLKSCRQEDADEKKKLSPDVIETKRNDSISGKDAGFFNEKCSQGLHGLQKDSMRKTSLDMATNSHTLTKEKEPCVPCKQTQGKSHSDLASGFSSSPGLGTSGFTFQKKPKYNGLESPQAKRIESKKLEPPKMVVDEWRDPNTDKGSEADCQSTGSGSIIRKEDKNAVRRRIKKAIHRSRSDLTKRYSNSSDLSELSARLSRNSAELEKFFNEMGLDRTVLEPMINNQFDRVQSTSDLLHLYESVSSLDSPDARSRSWESGEEGEEDTKSQPSDKGLKSKLAKEKGHQTSIVERNARIIKWLCSVKKASQDEES